MASSTPNKGMIDLTRESSQEVQEGESNHVKRKVEEQGFGGESKKLKAAKQEEDDLADEDDCKSLQEKPLFEQGISEALRKSEEERGQLKKKVEALRRRMKSQLDGHDQVMRTLQQSIGLKEEEHEQDVDALMRNLDDQELFLTKKFEDMQDRFMAASFNINLHEQLLTKQKKLTAKLVDKVSSHEQLLTKQKELIAKLVDKVECPVCLDIPRTGPVPVCPNGHVVCTECKAESCPTCRTAMGTGKSLLAVTVLDNIDHGCKFDDCNKSFALGEIEEHEAVCPHRTVICPSWHCDTKLPLDELLGHLTTSSCCANKSGPSKALPSWNCLNYSTVLTGEKGDTAWTVTMLEFSSEILVIYPVRSEGHYYFVPVMLASEEICSQFKVEMVVHEREVEASDSRMSVKFQGNPLSIDTKQSDLKLFGTSEQLMKKIQKLDGDCSVFSLSFKVAKEG